MTTSIKALVVITSDKCYLNKEWCWGYREIDEHGGKDPYSASKAGAELVFSAYQESFFEMRAQFGAASVKAGNVIGGGDQSVDRIVSDCIRAILKMTSQST
jgi:CDP-glucose 4,6-dehydratase